MASLPRGLAGPLQYLSAPLLPLVDLDALEQSSHLSKKELLALRVEYSRLANRAGQMDQDSFRRSLGGLGLNKDALLCQQLFAVFNKSNTGSLDFNEFANGLGCLTKGTVDEKLDFAFAMTDIDKSGEITFDEMLLTVQSMARIYSSMMGGVIPGDIDEYQVRKMFGTLDRDGDGRITLDEYKRGMKLHPEFHNTLGMSQMGMSQKQRRNDRELTDLRDKMAALRPLLTEALAQAQARPPPADDSLVGLLLKATALLTDSAPEPLPDPMPSGPSPSRLVAHESTQSSRLVKHESMRSARGSSMMFGEGNNTEGDQLERTLQSTKGTTVFFGHKNWDLVLNVMKGIQLAVSRSEHETVRALTLHDFHIKEKYTLVSGSDAQHCRFVDYAPYVFARLRAHFGIDNDEYVRSIGPGMMLNNLMLGSLSGTLAELGTEGKSGSFFYLSSDGKYFVKTVHKEEHKLLRTLLFKYYNHMTATALSGQEPVHESLLTRIVGCHVVRHSKHGKNATGAVKIYFVVMENALNCSFAVDRKYDLKGSWVGRRTFGDDPKATRKDMDFKESGDRIYLDGATRRDLVASLTRDTSFLEAHNIIDYSLLVGIHQLTEAEMAKQPKTTGPLFKRFLGGIRSQDGRQVYVLGIIDFLTPYGGRKMVERALKTLVLMDRRGISVMPPRAYARRFVGFLETEVIST